MDFRLLGPLEVRADDGPLPLGGVKQRTLLAALLLAAGQVVSRDRLIDALWGDQPPATAPHTLDAYVSRLRKVLGDGSARLLTRAPGYVVEVDPDALDLHRFEALLAAGREALDENHHAVAARLLREADGLWRGPPLADLAWERWAPGRVHGLLVARVSAVEDRVQAELDLGQHGALADELRGLVAEHPLRERLRAQLMLSLYRAGQQSEALSVHREGRALLVEELGLEPGADLRALEQAILRQDPALAWSPQAVEPVAGPHHPGRSRPAVLLVVALAGLLALGLVLGPSAYRMVTVGGSSASTPPHRSGASFAQDDLPIGRIAFRRFLDDSQTRSALFVIKPDGSGERQLTHPPTRTVDDRPSWSPDGREIAFERCPTGAGCSVWSVRPDGSHLRRVDVRCTRDPVCEAMSPSWMPNGNLVVGVAEGRVQTRGAENQIERFSVVVVDRRHAEQRTVVARDHWTGDTSQPAASPDGRTIAYVGRTSWKTQPSFANALFAVDADGSHPRRLTPWPLSAGDHPAFAPDSSTLLFRSYEDRGAEQSNYWTVTPSGNRMAQLTHFTRGRMILSASYSRDGAWIAIAADGTDGQADLYVMRADGTDLTPVTRTAAWDSAPDWGPPGR